MKKYVLKKPFVYIYVANLILLILNSITVFFGTYLGSFWLASALFLCLSFTVQSAYIAFYVVKPVLLYLKLNGRNKHLFSKNIAIFELALTAGIALLVGVVPAVFNFLSIPNSDWKRAFSDIMLAWITCIAAIQKNMLVHSRTVWLANRDRYPKKHHKKNGKRKNGSNQS